VLVKPEAGAVESATVKTLELNIKTLFVVSEAHPQLPFELDDASTNQAIVDA
jgi:hypothetical protein